MKTWNRDWRINSNDDRVISSMDSYSRHDSQNHEFNAQKMCSGPHAQYDSFREMVVDTILAVHHEDDSAAMDLRAIY